MVVLRPDAPRVAAWCSAGAVLIALTVWILIDSGGALLAWLFAVLAVVVAVFFAVQLVPSRFQVRLDPLGLEAVYPWGRTRLAWDDVELARVVRVSGESLLELHVRPAGAPLDAATRATGVLLPLGCDLGALHSFLEARLGRVPS